MIQKCKISDEKCKKSDFSRLFQGFRCPFLHKLQLQRGQKQQNLSLLQLMALVVPVTATATDTTCNCNCNRYKLCYYPCCCCSCGRGCLKKVINCNKDKLSCSGHCCSCSRTVWEKKSLNLDWKSAKKVIFCQKWQNNFFLPKLPK